MLIKASPGHQAQLDLEASNKWRFSVSPSNLFIRDMTHSQDLMVITTTGNVGIGTISPQAKLDVEGTVQAHAFDTGDIIFRKDGKQLWRMFEDERGLYLENLKSGESSKVFLEKDLAELTKVIQEQQRTIKAQQQNISVLTEKVKTLEKRIQ